MNMLEKGVFHIGVGTPGRVKALVEQGRRTRRVSSLGILYLVSWEVKLQLVFLGYEHVDLGTKLYGSVSSLVLCQSKQGQLCFMFTLSWHKPVLAEKGRVMLPLSRQSVLAYSPFLLPGQAQESVWQLSEMTPIKPKPVCTQNQVMSRQRWGTSSFGRNTDLYWLESECKTIVWDLKLQETKHCKWIKRKSWQKSLNHVSFWSQCKLLWGVDVRSARWFDLIFHLPIIKLIILYKSPFLFPNFEYFYVLGRQ